MASSVAEDYPSLLWVAIPSLVLVSAYYARSWYLARRLRVHGIGKGAPGFQTNVRQIRVTPEIAARLRRGEQVSPEEIAAASAEAEKQANSTSEEPAPRARSASPVASNSANEWLPENLTTPKKRGKGKRK